MTKRIDAIQYLRALAAVSVVAYHVMDNDVAVSPLRYATMEGKAGVDLFFVISGFVMAWTRLDRRLIGATTFMSHRLQRIVPLYWAATLLVLSIAAVAPTLTRTIRLSLPHVAASFLFIPAINPATGKYEPLVIPGWTLTYEMLFYLVFTVAIACARTKPVVTIVGAAAVMAALADLGALVHPTGVAGFYTNPIVSEFALGALAGLIVHRVDVAPSRWFMVPLLVAAVMLYLPGDWLMPPPWRRGLPATIMVVTACWSAMPRVRLLAIVGDASYSIYLMQALIIAAIRQTLDWVSLADTTMNSIVVPLLAVLVCVAAGVAIWLAVERPLTTYVRRLVGERSSRPAEAR